MDRKVREGRNKAEQDHAAGWAAIEPLLDGALDQPPEQREAWVRANAASESVAAEVLALLAAGERRGVLDTALPAHLAGSDPADDVRSRLAAALEGRYRIDGVLGRGGTATVFLAYEIKHARPVVLKVLRPEVALWVGAERFLTEISILAKLSHPHILALIDSGEADGLLYYVMPYVGGETLRERLGRGALTVDEALPLLRDIASALAYAHEHRFIHRDLKPDNVLVVAGHAYLMDFGIAKLKREARRSRDTTEGLAIGTPRYMAPEQAAGLPVDLRADIYSWAVVAAETLLGRVGGGKDLPDDVPCELRDLIEECLEYDPAKRPRDGAALVARLQRIGESRPPVRQKRWRAAAAAAVAVLAIAVFVAAQRRTPRLDNVVEPVMVVPLTNETGDTSLAVWGRMAGDWMTQGLHQTGRVAVVPWPVALQAATAARERGEHDLVRATATEADARTVVTGAYYLDGGSVRLQAQVTDVRAGTVLAGLRPIEVPRDSIRAGIQQLRDRVMAVFAIRTDQRLSSVPGLIDEPPTYEAYRSFERGIDRFNALDYAAATEAFLESWRRDTTFITPLVYAARAYLNRSEYERADSLVSVLQEHTGRLNPYHELMLRHTEAVLASDGKRALEMATRAAATAPDGRAHYTLASAALSLGQVDDALEALAKADPDRGLLRGWAPYWHVLTHAQHLKGDFALELKTTEELRRRHPDSRAGWVHHARVLAALRRMAAVDSLMAAASALPPDTYWSQGAMLVTIAEELDAHRHPGGEHYYQRAIDWLANQLARDPSHRGHRYWMGSALLSRGAPDDAAPYFESLVRDYPNDVPFRGLWGVTAALAGDTALARKRLGEPPKYRRGDYLAYLARYASIAGDTERAIALWSEAMNAGFNIVWLHATARREIGSVANDPRFRQLGILTRAPATP